MKRNLLLILLLVSLACLACAAVAGPQRTVVSNGMRPVTDSWAAIVTRDQSSILATTQALSSPAGIVFAPQVVGTGFQGIIEQDEINLFGLSITPPDTMGAVGPNHFVEAINGCLAIYDKTGTLVSTPVRLDSFFTFGIHPLGGTSHPRALYDRRSCRWFICCLEGGSPLNTRNDILLAVSRTNDPTGFWDKYDIPVGVPTAGTTTYNTLYDTLGTDDNGVYFGFTIEPSNGNNYSGIAATDKKPLISNSPGLSMVYTFTPITDFYFSPQPAHNQDEVKNNGLAWFFSSHPTQYRDLRYRYLSWSNTSPRVPSLSFSVGAIPTPDYNPPVDAEQQGTILKINTGDDRLQACVIRCGQLWTCRTIGVDINGGVATFPDRDACEWFQVDVSTAIPSLVQTGRVFNSVDPTGQDFYYYPSIMVNGQGHAAMSFNRSFLGPNLPEPGFVSAVTCGRLADDPLGTMQSIELLKAGEDPYQAGNPAPWGIYSASSLDPDDDMTIWTIQEYAETREAGIARWGTWISPLLAPPPTLDAQGVEVCVGTCHHCITLTGTGFYDPGPDYPNHLTVTFLDPDITNITVVCVSPTEVKVCFDVPSNATLGPEDIVLTNPDGQSVTLDSALTLIHGDPPIITCQPKDVCASVGGKAQFCVTASDTVPLTYQWKKDGVPIPGATSPCFTIDPICCPSTAGCYTVCVSNPCGTVESCCAKLILTPPDSPAIGCSAAKKQCDGAYVCFKDMIVTFNCAGNLYVEDPTDKCGIRVKSDGVACKVGDKVRIKGFMRTSTCYERYIEPVSWTRVGTGTCPVLTLTCPSVCGKDYYYVPTTGAGQKGIAGCTTANNIGSWVSCSGAYKYIDPHTCQITSSGATVKIICCTGLLSRSTKYSGFVTGVSACEWVGGKLCRVILCEKPGSITNY